MAHVMLQLSDGGGGGRVSSRTYDPSTGTWKPNTTNDDTPASQPSTSPSPAGTTNDTSKGSNLTATSTDKDSSTGKADAEYNTIEYNILEGELVFIVTEETIKLKAGDTIKLNGLGKYLSGDYYIVSINRSISNDGYSHSATVIRTNFGDKLKSDGSTTETKDGGDPTPKETETTPSTPAATSTPQRTYTVKKGDCLWNIAKMYYGSGAQYTKLVDANTKTQANPNLIFPGQVLIIP